MKPKIGIGLTTYQDIRSPEFATALYTALASVSPGLLPRRVKLICETHDVANVEDFSAHWHIERRFILRPKYGVAPPERWGEVGPTWRTKGSLSGEATVRFASQPNDPHTFDLTCNFLARLDWRELILKLVEAFKPAHAMLHVFTDEEVGRAGKGRFAFTQPIWGEPDFTSWREPWGVWRGPDPWQVEERRRYRFLPNLAWANYLGREFAGRYNEDALTAQAACVRSIHGGRYFELTSDIRDVVRNLDRFELERARLRSAFEPGVFRAIEWDDV